MWGMLLKTERVVDFLVVPEIDWWRRLRALEEKRDSLYKKMKHAKKEEEETWWEALDRVQSHLNEWLQCEVVYDPVPFFVLWEAVVPIFQEHGRSVSKDDFYRLLEEPLLVFYPQPRKNDLLSIYRSDLDMHFRLVINDRFIGEEQRAYVGVERIRVDQEIYLVGKTVQLR
ncbi:UNVERIFIED_ORG: hypothetical protein BDK47_11681 [Anoxybacillus amylolyticus]